MSVKAPKGGLRAGGKVYKEGQSLPRRYSQKMRSLRPVDPAAKSANAPPNYGRDVVPHVVSFSGMLTTLSRAYRHSDEALRDSVENAHMMLQDPLVCAPLLARQRMVALFNWHIEPEDEKDPRQKELAQQMTRILRKTPRFTEYRRSLLWAVWYGRYAAQHQFGFCLDADHKRRTVVRKWTPLSGDKIHFRYDDGSGEYDPDQIGIRVSPTLSRADAIAGNRQLEPTADGLAYFLQPWERSLVALHKHLVMDGEFEDPLSGSKIHGVGCRSFLYWVWYAKQETFAQLAELIDRTGSGIWVYWYPSGNEGARQEMEKVAREQAHTNVLLMPHETGDPDAYRIEHLQSDTGGIVALREMIEGFFGHQIIKFILGQTLSTEASATGLGSGVADLHEESLMQIVRYDSVNLEETITTDLLRPLQRFNFPKYQNIDLFFRIDTESTAPQEDLDAALKLWQMGGSIKASDLMDRLGLSMPTSDDDKLINPQIAMAMKQLEQADQQNPLAMLGMGGMNGGQGPLGMGDGGAPGDDGGMGGPPDAEGGDGLMGQDNPYPEDSQFADADMQAPQQMEEAEEDERLKLFGPVLNAPGRYEKQWDESKHPRAADGKFGSGGGAATAEPPKAKGKPQKQPKPKPNPKTAEQKEAEYEEFLKTKSPEDAAVFRKARRDGIAIPPAWTDVTYYGADKDIYAEGRDDKGRKQRSENPAYRQRLSDENNARISKELIPRMGELRGQLRKDAMAGDEEAKVLYLISLTGFRIGGKGDGKAKAQAFGASTLLGEHVSVNGDTVTFDFPGKKGVRQQHSVNDPLIAKMMKNAKKGEPVFSTRDTKVREAWQEKYGGTKVHDIRHVIATETARSELEKRIPPPPETAKERKAIVKDAVQVAANKLGNNPSQALSTYIDPGVWRPLQSMAIDREFSNPAARGAARGEIESSHQSPSYLSGIMAESKIKDRIEAVIEWAKKRGYQWDE